MRHNNHKISRHLKSSFQVLLNLPRICNLKYIFFCDEIILISSIILGPFAAVHVAIGSILADISADFGMYVPFIFVIKGLVAFVPAMLLRGKKITWKTMVFPFALAELIMVIGYFIADTILWDSRYFK